MNKDLNKLLCLLDGKITSYRLNNQLNMNEDKLDLNDNRLNKLINIQHEIQKLYIENKENKGKIIKKVK